MKVRASGIVLVLVGTGDGITCIPGTGPGLPDEADEADEAIQTTEWRHSFGVSASIGLASPSYAVGATSLD